MWLRTELLPDDLPWLRLRLLLEHLAGLRLTVLVGLMPLLLLAGRLLLILLCTVDTSGLAFFTPMWQVTS